MIVGSANLSDLFSHIPTVESFNVQPVELQNVEVLQVQYEIATNNVQSLLPPALDATLPPLGQWTAWQVGESPWGAFNLVMFRLSCRSGARPRSFLLSAAIDNPDAKDALEVGWGLASRVCDVTIERSYESARVTVEFEKERVLEFRVNDPEPLTLQDVQFFASMHTANTPLGLRLLQFDPTYEVNRVERYTPADVLMKTHPWGDFEIKPSYAVIGYGLSATIHLPKLRFACKPHISAFEGTEVLNSKD